MTDPLQTPINPVIAPLPHQGILHQTLGELLQNNKQAQNLIMHTMMLTPEKFQEILTSTKNNPLMNQTIGELFKNGTMQQAASQGGQVSPQQIQQIVTTLQTQDSQIITPIEGETNLNTTRPEMTTKSQKPSPFQKLKALFT